MTSQHNILSLFAGCGGIDVGFAQAGYRTISAIDNDSSAIETYRKNLGDAGMLAQLPDGVDLNIRPDVIVAGPPCQGFSTGGGYKPDDTRNSLFAQTCSIILELKPRLAVIENVAALTNRKNSQFLADAISLLFEGGYHCEYVILNAKNFGIPQERKRLFLIARSDRRGFTIPEFKVEPFVRLKDSIAEIDQDAMNHEPKMLDCASDHFKIATRIGEGQKLSNVRGGQRNLHSWHIPEVFGNVTFEEESVLKTIQRLRRSNRKRDFGEADPQTQSEIQSNVDFDITQSLESLISKGYLRKTCNHFDLTNTFNGKYRRLEWNGFSPTVNTRFGDFRLFLHPLEHRALTVRETARIQGFEDSFIFPENEKKAFQQIGNAVPPPLAKAVAEAVRRFI